MHGEGFNKARLLLSVDTTRLRMRSLAAIAFATLVSEHGTHTTSADISGGGYAQENTCKSFELEGYLK